MAADAEPEHATVPVVEETVDIDKRRRETGKVRVHTRVRQGTQEIDEPLESVVVDVERVPVGRWIDAPVAERQEGDTTIIPVIEEVAVVEKRLRLVEEVRLTRRRTTHRHRESVPVRRTEAEVERVPAPPERGADV